MDQKLIENWNSVIKPNDYIFHLGDFCFKGSQYWDNILNQLNGNIFLILGNHDEKNLSQGFMTRFEWVGYQLKILIGDRSIYLNHYPLLCYAGTYRDNYTIALHGHTHLSLNSMSGKDIERLNMCFPMQYDVGVDANNFTPISFEDVKEKIKEQIVSNQNQYQSFKEYLQYVEK